MAGSAAAFVGMLNLLAMSPLMPAMATDLHLSIGTLAHLATLGALVALAVLLVASPIADIARPRVLLTVGFSCVIAGALIAASADSVAVLALARSVTGVGDGLILPQALTLAASREESARSGIFAVTASSGASGVVGIGLIGVVATFASWRASFACLAVIATAVALFVLKTSADDVRENVQILRADRVADFAARYRQLAQDALRGGRLNLLLAMILGATVWWGLVTYAGALFRLRYGASEATITLLIPLLGAAYVAGSIVFAMLLRSSSESRLIQAALLTGVLTAAAVVLLAAPISLPVAASIGAVLAFSRPPGIAGLQSLLLRGESGKTAQGTALSYSQLVVTAGMLGGSGLGALFLGNGRPRTLDIEAAHC